MKDGRIVKVAGLEAPFGIAIDAQNRVWVSNSQTNTVIRFPAADPSKVETFKVGIEAAGSLSIPRAIAMIVCSLARDSIQELSRNVLGVVVEGGMKGGRANGHCEFLQDHPACKLG